jgi:hypothetical protein
MNWWVFIGSSLLMMPFPPASLGRSEDVVALPGPMLHDPVKVPANAARLAPAQRANPKTFLKRTFEGYV